MADRWRLLVWVCGIGAAGTPALAHHSVLGFDGTRAIEVVGTVHEVLWRNPHAYISVHVEGPDGEVERWILEGESPRVLERLGWTKTSIQPGDRVRSTGAPARDGRRMLRCQHVRLAAGSRLPCHPTEPL
jgi:hypothetical protein